MSKENVLTYRIDESELTRINDWLRRVYGIFPGTNDSCWRVVWSEDQKEKRHGTFTDYSDSGLFLREVTEVREVRKYPHIHNYYILERLTPTEGNPELIVKLSYEVLWTFRDKYGFPLVPKIGACWYIIEACMKAEHAHFGKKYKDPREDLKEFGEIKQEEVQEIYDQLFGNETPVGDALAYGRGVSVPSTYNKTQEN